MNTQKPAQDQKDDDANRQDWDIAATGTSVEDSGIDISEMSTDPTPVPYRRPAE